MTLLAARNLGIGYPSHPIVHGISFAIEAASVTCVLGPNGVGKTTLFKTMLGLLRPLAGSIEIDGRDVTTSPRQDVARALAYVPQQHPMNFNYSVIDLVVMGRTVHLGPFSQPGRQDYALAQDALERLGISDLAERDSTRLSGGQRQLVYIARALAQEARMMIMDEPTANLDLANRTRVADTIRKVASSGVAVIISTHDPEQALEIAGHVIMFDRAGHCEFGTPDDVMSADRLSTLYGVDLFREVAPSGRMLVTRRTFDEIAK